MGGGLGARIRAKFSRRNSAAPSLASSTNSEGHGSSSKRHGSPEDGHTSAPPATDDEPIDRQPLADVPRQEQEEGELLENVAGGQSLHKAPDGETAAMAVAPPLHSTGSAAGRGSQPQIRASDQPGNDQRPSAARLSSINENVFDAHEPKSIDDQHSTLIDAGPATSTDDDAPPSSDFGTPTPTPRAARAGVHLPTMATPTTTTHPPSETPLANRQTSLIRTLLRTSQADEATLPNAGQLLSVAAKMSARKIWVRRPGASATLVTIGEDDVVDDVRDMILRKYANSLGRQFDAPDLTLRIVPREQRVERTLGPEEPMGRTLDAYFPGGQSVDEALIIDVPLRRTPRASPRTGPPHAPHMTSAFFTEEVRPSEAGTDYFGPGALAAAAHVPVMVTAPSTGSSQTHAISVIATGQIPQIPSPGGTRSRQYRDRPDRPRLGRQHTSSPTILNAVGAAHAASIAATTSHEPGTVPPTAPPLPTPPAPEATSIQRVSTPPPQRVSSPRPAAQRAKKSKKSQDHPSLPAGTLGGGVPPINVLIVEDNIINLKLLEAFVKRLKVRWQTAMNGRDAVNKWRTGGFHLVLMDIQLPVMSGLDATREIRRLERVNSIGVFSSSASSAPEETNGEPVEGDRLPNVDMFKSPVIIVALTASSLQSDRHEALAAGCNDFLTKPVNFVWLERKVMEWGCMQALIDFDGWRKWKDFSQKGEENEGTGSGKKAAIKPKKTKNRQSLNTS